MKEKATGHLEMLCLQIQERCVGSSGNQAATAYFSRCFEDFGFAVEAPSFECFDWVHERTFLGAGNQPFHVFASPYSLPCRIEAPLCLAATEEELQAVDGEGKILLLQGDMAREQLMPKNFPFCNPEEHQKIIQLLETKGFQAVLAATQRNPEMAGGVYPFPLIEDGDFLLPSAYMTAEEGGRLSRYQGEKVSLEINALRKPSWGCNVVARKGGKSEGEGLDSGERVVVCAHIDSKQGTPGAIDNATGITVLLLLGELLAGYQADLQVEIVALNGEDYYSNPGEVLYLKKNHELFPSVLLGINIDGAGYYRGYTAVSLYDCPDPVKRSVQSTILEREGFIQGEPWYQGDHGLFLINQRPVVAITSDKIDDLRAIAHTPEDNLDIVDCTKLIDLAGALHALLLQIALGNKQ